MDWSIYGANGYTGALIAREAARRGMRPILAGRDREAVGGLARELGLAHRVFDLVDARAVAAGLEGVRLVLHCAGPFSSTAPAMMEACLLRGAHYLDITGEIDVLERAWSLRERARAAGVVLCAGVGFDVIPTDCLAATLKEAMPEAVSLALGFESSGGVSPGTARTSVEGLGKGGRVRRGGDLVAVPLGFRTRSIDFGRGPRTATTIPWGDVSTAFHTTGIPDIEVYLATSPRLAALHRRLERLRPLLRVPWINALLQRYAGRAAQGPTASARDRSPTYVWGEARDAAGATRVARVKTANGYSVTVDGSLAVVAWLLERDVPPGSYTPSQLMGSDFVSRLPGSTGIVVT